METWIISDVHLGARQCRAAWFHAFLQHVPEHVRLILNGDIVTRMRGVSALEPEHVAALDLLRMLSLRQEVIWVCGNHDRRVRLSGHHDLRYCNHWTVSKHLYIAHGDRFDHLSCALRFILLPIRVVYEFCTRVIGSQTHVADFAKRFPWVYQLLNGHVIRNATDYARRAGYKSVACGHTHHPGISVENGVTYFNTGCWTEDSAYVLICDSAGACRLVSVDSSGVPAF